VLSLAVKEGTIDRNPALRVGELIKRVSRGRASEVRHVSAWSREEVGTLLRLARRHERRFATFLHFLLATGARRVEALGLRWEDVDFERCRVTIRWS
jgi:integrase